MGLKVMMLDIVANGGNNQPQLIDYDHLNFAKKKIESKGLIDRIEYYLNYDAASKQYSNLMIFETYTYEFDGYVYQSITTVINWLNDDDTVGLQTTYYKPLLDTEKINFGMQKRENILSKAKLLILSPQSIGYANGVDMLQSLSNQIGFYIQGAPPSILTDAINALVNVKPYLTPQKADDINAILSDI